MAGLDVEMETPSPRVALCYPAQPTGDKEIPGEMTEITQLLRAVRDGEPGAMDAVFDLVYPQLKQLASSQMMVRPGQTLTPTVLVNETYLKLSQANELDLVDRRHFLICAARAMRHIAIDHARVSSARRRGGDQQRVTLTDVGNPEATSIDPLELDEALNDLAVVNSELKELVELKFFGGLTMDEIAATFGTSLRTVNRNWARARAFLNTRLDG